MNGLAAAGAAAAALCSVIMFRGRVPESGDGARLNGEQTLGPASALAEAPPAGQSTFQDDSLAGPELTAPPQSRPSYHWARWLQILSFPAMAATALAAYYRIELNFELEPLITSAVLLVLNFIILEMAIVHPAPVTASRPGIALPSDLINGVPGDGAGAPATGDSSSSPFQLAEAQLTLTNSPNIELRPLAPHVHMLPYSAADISGFWVKDKERSDCMEEACRVMKLGGLVRQGIKLIKGLRLDLQNSCFSIAVVSVIPLIKVSEQYQLTGSVARFKRRDLRRGKHWGRVEVTSAGIVVLVRWEEPLAGHGLEVFKLVGPDELHVISEMYVSQDSVRYRSIYHKRQERQHP